MDFDTPGLLRQLELATDDELDALELGIIGFDDAGLVTRYNRYEAALSRMDPARVKGRHLFTAIAPCMNTPLIAEKIRVAEQLAEQLDETIDYVLAFKPRPLPVRLRMLFSPGAAIRYLVIRPATGA